MKLQKLFKENQYFYLSFFLFLILGGALLWYFPKRELHLIFNNWHSELADSIFLYLTHVGDGLTFAALVLLLLLFRSYFLGVMGLCSLLLSSFLAQFLKRVVFSGHPRPKKFFTDSSEILNFVEGVKVHSSNSFPSGHTTTAFTMFCLIVLLYQKKDFFLANLLLIIACLIGFSRVYLQQHFFEDIYAGAVLGIFSSTLVYYLFQNSSLKNSSKWKRSLMQTLRKPEK